MSSEWDGDACGVGAAAGERGLGCCLFYVKEEGDEDGVVGTWTSRPAVKALAPAAVTKIARMVGDSCSRFMILERFIHILGIG